MKRSLLFGASFSLILTGIGLAAFWSCLAAALGIDSHRDSCCFGRRLSVYQRQNSSTRWLAGSNPCMDIWLLREWIVRSVFLRGLVGARNDTVSTSARSAAKAAGNAPSLPDRS